jgi:hypothetical protein
VSPSRTPDLTLVSQVLGDGEFVLLARREHEGHQLPVPFHSHVELGAEPALAAS